MHILDERKQEIVKRDAAIKNAKVCSACSGGLDKLFVCTGCGHHERMPAAERVKWMANDGAFEELLKECDVDHSRKYCYFDKFQRDRKRTGLDESVVVGKCKVAQAEFVLIVMERYMMVGTISKANGEKIARAFEYATKQSLPIVAFLAGGGVRIQEGAVGLVQMAKIDAVLSEHRKTKLPFISVLTDPTYGGTTASLGLMGDVNIAEPNTSIGFGGKMLVKDILHEKIPDDFQSAEYVLTHGGIDMICERRDLRERILRLLDLLHQNKKIVKSKKPNYDYEPKKPVKVLSDIRSGSRPTGIDYLFKIFEEPIMLSGDRISYDDASLLCGVGKISGISSCFIIQNKGRNLEENLQNNFGMTRPEGFRKAIRVSKLAEKFCLPILILLDSPGAHPGGVAESNCQSIAISECMMNFLRIKTPVIAIVTGEGCSGGALALSIADSLAMFSGATYAVISPESYSSILFNSLEVSSDSLDKMRFTAYDLYQEKIIDEILEEKDLDYNATQVKNYFAWTLAGINKFDTGRLLERRYNRIRNWDKND